MRLTTRRNLTLILRVLQRMTCWRRCGTLLLQLSLFAGVILAMSPAVAESGITSIGMTVADLERSVAFYRDQLDFTLVSAADFSRDEMERRSEIPGAVGRFARLQLGDEILELTEFSSPKGRPMPSDSRSNDLWFQHVAIVVRDMSSAYERLHKKGVVGVSRCPQRLPDWNSTAGGIEAYYFRDPDEHFLELIHFPPDKGLAKWHRDSTQLFLGIDHTAIVVADTERSLSFYRDHLGLSVTGTSENCGIEQERLNNIPGARLKITSLRGTAGTGIELLQYLTPNSGRPRPSDSRANDLWHWYIRVTATGSNRKHCFLVEDPDGHVVEFVAPSGIGTSELHPISESTGRQDER